MHTKLVFQISNKPQACSWKPLFGTVCRQPEDDLTTRTERNVQPGPCHRSLSWDASCPPTAFPKWEFEVFTNLIYEQIIQTMRIYVIWIQVWSSVDIKPSCPAPPSVCVKTRAQVELMANKFCQQDWETSSETKAIFGPIEWWWLLLLITFLTRWKVSH